MLRRVAARAGGGRADARHAAGAAMICRSLDLDFGYHAPHGAWPAPRPRPPGPRCGREGGSLGAAARDPVDAAVARHADDAGHGAVARSSTLTIRRAARRAVGSGRRWPGRCSPCGRCPARCARHDGWPRRSCSARCVAMTRRSLDLARHGPAGDLVGQNVRRIPPALPGLAVQAAELAALGRVDPVKAYPLAVHLNGIAVDRPGDAGRAVRLLACRRCL